LPGLGEADLRYAGQSFELTVPLGGDLAEAFHRAHEERYGYAERTRPLELVAVRTADVEPGPEFRLPPGEPLEVAGPALVELDGATCWVPPGWEGARDGNSTLILTRA
jgi:N-methylhydantoinase A